MADTPPEQWPDGWLAQRVKENEERLTKAENLIKLLMRRTEKLHHRTSDLEEENPDPWLSP